MAMPDIGTGTTVVFSGTGAPTTFDNAKITNVSLDGHDRASSQSSHMGTLLAHTFIIGDLYDPGELSIEGWLDIAGVTATNAWAANAWSDYSDITTGFTIVVNFAGVTTEAFVAKGWTSGFGFSVPLEDMISFTLSFKLSGVTEWTTS
jgi:hypothetical protein